MTFNEIEDPVMPEDMTPEERDE
ncbi:hypothetical protein KIPB_009267, partial [Kipferlia bialata]|eukprot:g9267.t1